MSFTESSAEHATGYLVRGAPTSLVPTPCPFSHLQQIFSHIAPLDLLHLSRTTKAVRDILMRRSAAFVWKASLSRVEELPECPDDLNEVQYARLLFETNCFVSIFIEDSS